MVNVKEEYREFKRIMNHTQLIIDEINKNPRIADRRRLLGGVIIKLGMNLKVSSADVVAELELAKFNTMMMVKTESLESLANEKLNRDLSDVDEEMR